MIAVKCNQTFKLVLYTHVPLNLIELLTVYY